MATQGNAGGAGRTSVLVEVSPGELIDKITILEIKVERLRIRAAQQNAAHELALLRAILIEYNRSLITLDRPWRVAAAWEEAAELPGKPYRIQLDGKPDSFEAIAQGVAVGGGLRVIREDGRSETVSTADARVLR